MGTINVQEEAHGLSADEAEAYTKHGFCVIKVHLKKNASPRKVGSYTWVRNCDELLPQATVVAVQRRSERTWNYILKR